MAAQILANSWYSHRANKRLVRHTRRTAREAELAHEVLRRRPRAGHARTDLRDFSSKTVK